MKKLRINNLLSIVTFLIGVLFIFMGFSSYKDIDNKKAAVKGIDISAHTGNINFSKLKQHNISFVYMKATEGANYVDPKFRSNYSKAVNKIPIGFYHFFRFNKPGNIQADNFIRNIKGKKYNLPLVVDVEDWGNSSHNKKRNEIINQLRIFIKKVEQRTGKKMLIYTNESGYRDYIRGNFDKNDLWICSFKNKPNVKKRWTLWQYTHTGKIRGVKGYVDFNVFNGNKAQWNRFLRRYR